MLRRRLIWQLYPSFLAVTLLALIAVTWQFSGAFRSLYYRQTRLGLHSLAHFAAERASTLLQTPKAGRIDEFCKRLGGAKGLSRRTRVTVILPSGKVIGDSDEDPALMSDHSDRPEIIDALDKGFGWSVRPSPTLGIKMMYAAIPIEEEGRAIALVRTSVSVSAIDRALSDMHRKMVWGGVVVALCAAVLSFVISRGISRPVMNMEQIAQRFAAGQLDLRVPVPAPLELAALAKALNEMARQLHEKIATITSQRNELEAVLSSMVEGVVAVDHEGHIVSINKAAAALLGIDPAQVYGRSIEEVVREVNIQQFVRKALKEEGPIEAEVSLRTNGEKHFQLLGASLRDAGRGRTGAVIVLHDITRMRRLEAVRKDFVANVSHELRTPVTSIQGFVEALSERGIDDPEQTKRYLGIIAKHSDRLNSIIEDLLSLSRLEEDQEQRRIELNNRPLKPLLATAIDLLRTKAEKRGVSVELLCGDDIQAKINSALIEQAVFNLVDNAVKYSKAGGAVTVSAEQGDAGISISVQDRGCGISSEHLSRLFERFYVVDRGRSRKLGGTGLGLAIVKHIAQVHGGAVTVKSSPGKGSTFTIHLPQSSGGQI